MLLNPSSLRKINAVLTTLVPLLFSTWTRTFNGTYDRMRRISGGASLTNATNFPIQVTDSYYCTYFQPSRNNLHFRFQQGTHDTSRIPSSVPRMLPTNPKVLIAKAPTSKASDMKWFSPDRVSPIELRPARFGASTEHIWWSRYIFSSNAFFEYLESQ